MQTKDSIEDWYKNPDPWGYRTSGKDRERKDRILSSLHPMRFARALDIGAGEGFITKDLPADSIEAIEWSDNASARFPEGITRVEAPKGSYDLVVATGVLYPQYEYLKIHKWIKDCATGIILTCNITGWEIPLEWSKFKEVHKETWPYGEHDQTLRLYEVTT